MKNIVNLLIVLKSTFRILVFSLMPIFALNAQDVQLEKLLNAWKAEDHKNAFQIVQAFDSVNFSSADGQSLLILAAKFQDTTICKYLLDKQANVNYQDTSGRTALFHTASRGFSDIVKFLLNRGAKVNLPRYDGLTPLMIATYNRYTDVVRLLLESGANCDVKEFRGHTAFYWADTPEIVSLLFNSKAKKYKLVDQFLGVCYLQIQQSPGSNRVADSKFIPTFQDCNSCKKYSLKGEMDVSLSNSPTPCKILGQLKGGTIQCDAINIFIEKNIQEATLKKYNINCKK
jgi:hypothetical protein